MTVIKTLKLEDLPNDPSGAVSGPLRVVFNAFNNANTTEQLTVLKDGLQKVVKAIDSQTKELAADLKKREAAIKAADEAAAKEAAAKEAAKVAEASTEE